MTLRNRPVVIAVQHAGASTLEAISPVLSTSGVSEPPAGRAGMRRRSPIYSLVRDKVAPAGLACATNGVILEFPASRQASGEFTEPDQLPPGDVAGFLTCGMSRRPNLLKLKADVSFRLERGQDMRVKVKHNTVQEQVLTLNRHLRDLRTVASKLRTAYDPVAAVRSHRRKASRQPNGASLFQACPTTSGIIGLRASNVLLMPTARSIVGWPTLCLSTPVNPLPSAIMMPPAII
jgi:hypothetical protein